MTGDAPAPGTEGPAMTETIAGVTIPGTTFGTMNDDVLAHVDPHVGRTDFVEVVLASAWPD